MPIPKIKTLIIATVCFVALTATVHAQSCTEPKRCTSYSVGTSKGKLSKRAICRTVVKQQDGKLRNQQTNFTHCLCRVQNTPNDPVSVPSYATRRDDNSYTFPFTPEKEKACRNEKQNGFGSVFGDEPDLSCSELMECPHKLMKISEGSGKRYGIRCRTVKYSGDGKIKQDRFNYDHCWCKGSHDLSYSPFKLPSQTKKLDSKTFIFPYDEDDKLKSSQCGGGEEDPVYEDPEPIGLFGDPSGDGRK